MTDMRTFLYVVGFILAVLVLMYFVIPPSPVKADGFTDCDLYYGCPARKRRHVHRSRPERVYAYERRDPEDEGDRDGPRCLPVFVEITSTEHQSPDKAMDVGRKMWSGTTQWKWGSRWMNFDNAAEVRAACDQTNDMASASGQISEIAGAVTGRGGVNVRCVIRARPCRAILEKVEGHR